MKFALMILENDTMARLRQSKYKRAERPGPFRFTDGDIQILQLVHSFRYITTPMLMAVTGRTQQKINERARKLLDNEYLERVHLPHPRQGGGSRESIHILDDKGFQVLSDHSKIPRKQLGTSPKDNKNPDLILRHKLLISHTQAAVMVAINQVDWLELLFWRRESEEYKQKVYVKGEELRVYPDAFFGIRNLHDDKRHFFFLEADRDTMDYADMRDKYAAYYKLYKQHQHDGSPVFDGIKKFRVLTVIEPATPDRLPGLISAAHEATPQGNGDIIFWFVEKSQLLLDGSTSLLASIWRVAINHSEKLYSVFR